jgi:hypothetical protein
VSVLVANSVLPSPLLSSHLFALKSGDCSSWDNGLIRFGWVWVASVVSKPALSFSYMLFDMLKLFC